MRWFRRILPGIALLVFIWPILYGSASGQTVPYRVLSEAGAGFFGYGREYPEPDALSTVRIGLTGPAKTKEGRHLRYGVALAVEEANSRGGYHGIPFEVVFRPDDGPWGIAAKQVVHLTYEDEVWTILGALDGHHAHLAELIAAKAWIPVITPCASDLTIDYANVPWVFRCAPDDGRQARALVRYARQQQYERIIVLTEGDRESRIGWERLRDAVRHEQHHFAMHIEYDPYSPTAVVPRLHNMNADAFIIWGNPEGVLPLINAIRERGIATPVLGPALLATPEFAEEARGLGDIVVAAPYDMSRENHELRDFYRRYTEYAGMSPSPVALYAYDATRMIQNAVEKAGLNRARIRDELAGMSFDGLVGKIHFNDLGGNPTEPVLMTLRLGKWVKVE
jgi:branched-chain amino acid transport system substrate-binding protein